MHFSKPFQVCHEHLKMGNRMRQDRCRFGRHGLLKTVRDLLLQWTLILGPESCSKLTFKTVSNPLRISQSSSDNLQCENSDNLVSRNMSTACDMYSVSLHSPVAVPKTNLPVGVVLDVAAASRQNPTSFSCPSEVLVAGLWLECVGSQCAWTSHGRCRLG